MNAVTHLEKVITGEVSAVTHLEKVIAGETSAVTYTEKVITGEAPPITHLQRVIAGVESPVTHLEYVWAGGSPTPTEHEYTGVVPYTFRADGEPLLDWYIYGNTVQNGTPSPENPIQPQETGERTGNLLDYTTVESTTSATATQISGGISVSGQYYVRFRTVEFTVGSTYTMSWKANTIGGTSAPSWRFHYADNTYSSMPSSGESLVVKKEVSELLLYVSTSANCVVEFTEIMLNSGSTALPYEPYGYKIPISSANTTTPVYLGKVESTRRIKKLVLTGNEPFTKNDGQSTHYLYYANKGMIFPRSIGKTPVICNELPEKNNAPQTIIGINANNTFGVVYFNFGAEVMNAQPSGNTVAGLKEYLTQQYAAGTPVTVWYVLDIPETAVVNEPLRKIGDYADTVSMSQAGITIPTNNGSTTIDVDTTVKPSEVYIKYKGV